MSATIHRSVSGATLADCEAQLEPGETIDELSVVVSSDRLVSVKVVAPESSAVAEKVSESAELDRARKWVQS